MSARRRGRPSGDTIDRIQLSSTVKCIICNKNQLPARYSNKQLTKYKESIYFQGTLNAERPTCSKCTGGPKLELQCSDCGKVKSLDEFSKNARMKDRDNALCWDCQQRVLDQEPILEDALEEDRILEERKRNGSSAYGMSSLGSSLPSGSKKSSASSETGTDVSGHVLIAPPVSPGQATTSRGRTQANGSNDYSRQRSNSQESVKTTDTRETSTTTTSRVRWDNICIEPSYRRPRSNGSAVVRWVKQEGGHKKTAMQKAEDDVQRFAKQAANQQRVRDDDDDDSASSYEM